MTKPRKKGTSRKGSGKTARRRGGLLVGARDRAGEVMTQEVVGVALLVLGLFFSGAFLSGRGAFLGKAGFVAATHLMGVVGLLVAPLAAVGGLLLLLGRLPGRRALGAALLLLAGATTLASTLPRGLRFSSEFYAEAGGLLGSGVYGAVHWAGGAIGAALVLCLLYVLGLYLLTGVSPRSAVAAMRGWGETFLGRLRIRRREARVSEGFHGAREERSAKCTTEPVGVRDLRGEPTGVGDSATKELEVVLPQRREATPFAGGSEAMPGEYIPPSPSLLNLGRGDPGHDAEETSRRLTRALSDLGVEAQV
ncbi:MAG TPA: DNA translocase FtsK 4TM domain-containing protein, partial [Rubrobacter sp.]|nr:DNA translocase FtsK 4TM domain-containing protein [Rubrobacter sp.]